MDGICLMFEMTFCKTSNLAFFAQKSSQLSAFGNSVNEMPSPLPLCVRLAGAFEGGKETAFS